MKINKILIIIILTIIIIILSFKTQGDIPNNRKIVIPKIIIPKVTAPQTTTNKKEDELSKVISGLKSIVEEEDEKSIQQDNPTDDEVRNILSSLKALKPIEKKQIVVVKKSVAKKKVDKKRDIINKRQIIIYKEIIVEKSSTKEESTITAEEYRKRLAKESKVDEDIASLSMVDTVDMDIEQKIKKGKVKELTTPKPIVEQETIYIPSGDKKIEEDIPWAKLREVDEKVDGIFIRESIN